MFPDFNKSSFRSKFRLYAKEIEYLNRKGLDVIASEARYFSEKRIVPASPINDGRQTPTRNHPVFIAQHATATCCRKCLAKWHHIPPNIELNDNQIEYIVLVIMSWLKKKL